MKNRIYQFIALLMIVVIFSNLQTGASAKSETEDLIVTASFATAEAIAPNASIEFNLSRALHLDERIGVIIEKNDVSGLFTKLENRLRYNANLLPLALGDSKITIYLIKNNDWKEIASFPLSVKENKSAALAVIEEQSKVAKEIKSQDQNQNSPDAQTKSQPEVQPAPAAESSPPEPEKPLPFGFAKLGFVPSITLNLKPKTIQLLNFPEPPQITDQTAKPAAVDFGLQLSAKNELARGAFGVESNFDFAGSSKQDEALQFGTLGARAPQIDLSSYLIQLQIGKVKLAWGHTSFGNNRHLVNSFSSRGLSVNVPLNKRFDVTAGFLNGTSLVGFGNFFGLKKVDHQVQGATLGIEIFPKRASALRLELTGFNGYIQPLNSVGEARINDAERSRGGALRLLTSDKSERFKLEAGFSRSRFQNPRDTQLDPDGNSVSLPPVSRSAHYLDASYQILKDVAFTNERKINLNFALRHEFVEPLYKSLGASAGADKTTQDYALENSIGDITLAFGHTRFNDNLRNVASILKSLTRVNRFAVAVPVATFFSKPDKPLPFFPKLSYNFDQTHQFGAGVPVNGGFEIDLSAIPDLINTNQSFNSAWQFKKFNLEYRYNRSFSNNRQTARELFDQLGYVHGFAVGLNPFNILSLTAGLNFENSHNFETNQTNRTKALTLGGTWQPFKGATFGGNLSHTLAGDAAKTNRNHNTNYDFQFAYNFSREKSKFRKIGMQAFLRYADTFSRTRDFIFDANNLTKSRITTAGITFNFF